MSTLLAPIFAATLSLALAPASPDVVLETADLRFVVGGNACAKSLVLKATGEECLDVREGLPLLTVTQERPFNNEIKLALPNKRTTCRANRIRREGDKLVVGFELASYEAVLAVKTGPGYLGFELDGIRCNRELHYEGLAMDVPPIAELRLLQLPVKARANVGDWLNVVWDDRAAVAVIGTDPRTVIDLEARSGFELLTADLRRDLKLVGGRAAIVAGAGREGFLDAMDVAEGDFALPRGVRSRRNPLLKHSMYWTESLWPENVDAHLALARQAGMKLMLLYYPCFERSGSYSVLGNYDWNDHYANRERDVKVVLDKIRAAGILPGFHTLQTHIGKDSRYVTPVADPRLNIKQRFTLAKPIPAAGDVGEIEVLENTYGAPTWTTSPRLREKGYGEIKVLKFGGELFFYEGYTTTPPYRFTGVKRGHWKTTPAAHPRGEIGGVLDVSEFIAISCYIDQTTDLQDEIAEKIARICDQGMGFCYFDGSEGVNNPAGVYVALSQYRVTSKFKTPPVFTEGAAKSHFGWHQQAGANAFDIFPPEVFKEMIVRHPLAEAPLMAKNFTRVDFGWWCLYQPGREVELRWSVPYRKVKTVGTQLDMWEFGTSRAAAWDCCVTIMMDPDRFAKHPRGKDLLETMRRWEDVRANGFLTPARKTALKSPTQEHHLYVNEKGEYELCEIAMLPTPATAPHLRGFLFERGGKRVVACWHTCGAGTLEWTLGPKETLSDLKYITTDLPSDAVKAAWAGAKLEDK